MIKIKITSNNDDLSTNAAIRVKDDFVQCPHCSSWVCREKCWNPSKGLCKMCSPDLGIERTAAQSSRTVEEIWAHSQMAEDARAMFEEESWREVIRATCPE